MKGDHLSQVAETVLVYALNIINSALSILLVDDCINSFNTSALPASSLIVSFHSDSVAI